MIDFKLNIIYLSSATSVRMLIMRLQQNATLAATGERLI